MNHLEDLFPFLQSTIHRHSQYLGPTVSWGLFALVCTVLMLLKPRQISLQSDTLLVLISLLKAAAQVCRSDLVPHRNQVLKSVVRLGDGEFLYLLFLVSRGYALTRYELTGMEVLGLAVTAAVFLVAPVMVPAALVVIALGVMIAVFTCKTMDLLAKVYPGIGYSRNTVVIKKCETFKCMCVLFVSSLTLPLSTTIGVYLVYSDAPAQYYAWGKRITDFVCPALFAIALLLLQRKRDDREYSAPLVDCEDVYRVKFVNDDARYVQLRQVV